MIPVEFDYVRPRTLDEALATLADESDSRPLAGGQSLLPLLKLRVIQPERIVDLSRVPGLTSLRIDGKVIEIGAMATERQVEMSEEVSALCPLLTETLRVIADPHVRNLGTIGGALCQADPRGDLSACMLALGPTLTAVSSTGSRTIAIEDFFVGPFTTALRPDELLTTITVPIRRRSSSAYIKLARRAGDFAIVGAAARIDWDTNRRAADARIAVCGASAMPFFVDDVDGILTGSRIEDSRIERLAQRAQEIAEPLPDPLVSPEYRSAMVHAIVTRAMTLARSRGEEMQ